MNVFSAVLFDVDGTLYDARGLHLLLAVCLVFGWIRHPIRTVKEIRILIHYRRVLEWMRHNPLAAVHADSQAERVSAETGVSLDDVKSSINRWVERIPLRLLPFCARRKLIRMIKQWYKMGIPMGVYSDYPAEEKLRKLGIRKCMSVVLCSSDAGVQAYKPDPKGLQVLAQKMGQAPEACVYLGDRKDIDLCSARRANMHGLIFSKKNLNWLGAQIGGLTGFQA